MGIAVIVFLELIAVAIRYRNKTKSEDRRFNKLDYKQKVAQTFYVTRLYALKNGMIDNIAKKEGVKMVYPDDEKEESALTEAVREDAENLSNTN